MWAQDCERCTAIFNTARSQHFPFFLKRQLLLRRERNSYHIAGASPITLNRGLVDSFGLQAGGRWPRTARHHMRKGQRTVPQFSLGRRRNLVRRVSGQVAH